ncbi:MAG: hypothetical protein EPN45_09495, partial [Rhizobiaceae bacterium]
MKRRQSFSRRDMLLLAGSACLLPSVPVSVLAAPEPPDLAKAIAGGKLPPLEQRLPHDPRIVDMAALGKSEGRYGGSMRMIMASAAMSTIRGSCGKRCSRGGSLPPAIALAR